MKACLATPMMKVRCKAERQQLDLGRALIAGSVAGSGVGCIEASMGSSMIGARSETRANYDEKFQSQARVV